MYLFAEQKNIIEYGNEIQGKLDRTKEALTGKGKSESFMPTISMFYGIIIYMYFFDNKKHNKPHIHAEYAEYKAVFSIENAELIDGKFPNKKTKMVQAWIAIHEEELMADWKLASEGKETFNIEPLR